VTEMVIHGPQACFDISQALPVGELSERYSANLVPASEGSGSTVTVISINAFTELVARYEAHEQREDRLALVHGHPFCILAEGWNPGETRSNR